MNIFGKPKTQMKRMMRTKRGKLMPREGEIITTSDNTQYAVMPNGSWYKLQEKVNGRKE